MNRRFPESLKNRPIWLLWKIEEKDGRKTKVPYSANFRGRASSTNPRTWATFDRVEREFNSKPGEYNGIGLVVSEADRLIFIDIDHTFSQDGKLTEPGIDILEALSDQYVEVSQSGSGLHILAFGRIPKNFKNSGNGVEMYSGKRFVAMTGNTLGNGEPHDNPEAIEYVFSKYKTPEKAKSSHTIPNCYAIQKSDEEIIQRAMNHGSVFSNLWAGQWDQQYGSRSEADSALCVILAFWTDADPEKMDLLFRASGLYREKWLRDDYREKTIQNAIGYCKETFSEYVQRMREEEKTKLEQDLYSKW